MSHLASPLSSTTRSRALSPLAAGLALTSAGSASAQIVYVANPSGATATFTSPYNFSIKDEGHDFSLSVPSFGPTSTKATFTALTPGDNVSITSLGSTVGPESAPAGTSIDLGSTQSYVAFSLTDSTTLYGWASLGYGFAPEGATIGLTATLIGYAYDTTGAAITVGATSAIPEPSTTAAITGGLALLAGSGAVWKRRRQRLQAA